MPTLSRYFFHIGHGGLSPDQEGTKLQSADEARTVAVAMLGEILRDSRDTFWTEPSITITVTDATSLILWTLTAFGHSSAATAASADRR